MTPVRIMPATVNDDGLKRSLIFSAGLHVLLLILMIIGLPHLMPPLPEHHDTVPFEIVEIADMTNTRLKDQPEDQKPPEPTPKPEQKTQQAMAQPTPPIPTPPTPAPPQTQPQQPAQAEALLPKPAEKPKPVEKPQPKPDLMASVLKNVAQIKKTEQAKADTQPDAKTDAPAAASHAPSLSDRLTISEEDALRRQIESCWSPPIGAKDAQNLVIDVKITVNADKTVQTAEVVDKSRMATDSFYRAAAEAAIRALYNPKCSPLLLPDGKYEEWKNTSFTFDPRDM